jgi:hypothetical protein
MEPHASRLVWALLAAAGCCAGSALASPQAGAAPPHIFFILVDDLGYADVGFNRAKPDREVVTPNLNGLVSSGVHLTRHCKRAAGPFARLCLSSRRLTGTD